MARQPLPVSKLRIRKRRRRIRIAFLAVCALLALFLIFAGLAHASFWRITTIEVAGTKSVATAQIETAVQEALSGSYAYILPKDQVFFYPEDRIVESLRKQFPALSYININAKNMTTLRIEIGEYSPYALWCGESTASSSACLLMDEHGAAYGSAHSFSESAYVRYYGELHEATLPRQYLSEDIFRSLAALLAEMQKDMKDYRPIRVEVDDIKDVRAAFDGGFTILFSLSEDSAKVYQRYMLARTSEPFKDRPLSDFEYLDLRFGDSLYYKAR